MTAVGLALMVIGATGLLLGLLERNTEIGSALAEFVKGRPYIPTEEN